MQRLGLIIVPGFIAIALFVGISTLDTASNESDNPIDTSSLNFSAYSEGINTILYDASGNINYTLQAERQVHFVDDTTELEKPLIRLYQDGGARWNIVANSGRISADNEPSIEAADKIDLLGNVQVYSLDELGNRTLMSSEFLTLNPESEVLETDQPVSVVTEAIEQTSIGMIAKLRTDEITFLREIRGRHESARD
ncbi:MAG: hypothetical protein DHS20C12_20430 [Pseudohongiella sp.]|nr:MAG: hypothetical protein DHS20C12_20430 [Pseudohongiella sp.]